jgi:2-polyprenyl-3-methyl-5-hydroxy-6-metoxy-1,4-benzoquinol methylase
MNSQTIQATYFDQQAHRFDQNEALSPSSSQLMELDDLAGNLHIKQKSSIMDFGAGSGRVTFYFLKRGHNVTAVDVSQKSLETLTKMYRANKTSSWGTLITTTTIPKHTLFDSIVGADILHHIDMPTYLRKFHASLRPGGSIAFSEPNGGNLLWYLFLLIARLPWDIEKGITKCTYTNLRKQFRTAGFTQCQINGHGIIPTRLTTRFPMLAQINIVLSHRIRLFTPIAFRFIITALR